MIIPARALLERAEIIGDAEGQCQDHGYAHHGGQVLFTEHRPGVAHLIEGRYRYRADHPKQPRYPHVKQDARAGQSGQAGLVLCLYSSGIVRLTFESGGELAPAS